MGPDIMTRRRKRAAEAPPRQARPTGKIHGDDGNLTDGITIGTTVWVPTRNRAGTVKRLLNGHGTPIDQIPVGSLNRYIYYYNIIFDDKLPAENFTRDEIRPV